MGCIYSVALGWLVAGEQMACGLDFSASQKVEIENTLLVKWAGSLQTQDAANNTWGRKCCQTHKARRKHQSLRKTPRLWAGPLAHHPMQSRAYVCHSYRTNRTGKITEPMDQIAPSDSTQRSRLPLRASAAQSVMAWSSSASCNIVWLVRMSQTVDHWQPFLIHHSKLFQ